MVKSRFHWAKQGTFVGSTFALGQPDHIHTQCYCVPFRFAGQHKGGLSSK